MKMYCYSHRETCTHTNKISINPMELNLIIFSHCCRAFVDVLVCVCTRSIQSGIVSNHFFLFLSSQHENIFIFQLVCATMLFLVRVVLAASNDPIALPWTRTWPKVIELKQFT